jgi:tetratricopeptide (TPR) repeat protein
MKKTTPKTYHEWTAYAQECDAKGDNQGLLHAYTQADRLRPGQAWLVGNLAKVQQRLRNWEACILHAENAIALSEDGGSASPYYRLRAVSFQRLGNLQAAADSWKKALEVHPLPAYLEFYNHACGLALTGSFEYALKNLEIALEISPENAASAREDSDFEAIKDTPEFQALLDRIEDGDSNERTTWHLHSPSKILRIRGVQKAAFCITAFGCTVPEWPALIPKICHEDYFEETATAFVGYVLAVERGGDPSNLSTIAKALVDYWDAIQTKSALAAIGEGLHSIDMALRFKLQSSHQDFARAIIRLLQRASAFAAALLEDRSLDSAIDQLCAIYCGLTLNDPPAPDMAFADALIALFERYNFSLTTNDKGQRIANAASDQSLTILLRRFDELVELSKDLPFHDNEFPAWSQLYCVLMLLVARPSWLPAIQAHWSDRPLPPNAAEAVMYHLLDEADYDAEKVPQVIANETQAYFLLKASELDPKPENLVEWETLLAEE